MIPVAAGLVVRNGLLLITRRPPGTHLAGLWEFPGGKVQPGESWEDALRRELLEEIGCEVRVGPLYEEIVHAYPGKTVQLRFHRCTPLTGEPRAIECAELAWVDRAALAHHDFPAADARLLERLRLDEDFWQDPGF